MSIDFRTWLSRHKNRNSPLGDLATDALSKGGGWTGDCPETLRDALDRLRACSAAYDTLDAAVKQWRRYNKSKQGCRGATQR